jgi:thiol peroxidase
MKFLTAFITFSLILTLNSLSIFVASAKLFDEDNLQQTTDLVQANNKFITLLGTQVNVGQKAPDFKVVNASFVPVTLKEFSGKNILISVVPSLDTGVCALQTKRFNEEMAKLPQDIIVLTISNDLPFAQKRFCEAESIDKITVLSDSVWRNFGSNYGLLIKDMGLLTRAIFIIDSSGVIAYKEIVADISKHPNYELALSTIQALSPIEALDMETVQENNDK